MKLLIASCSALLLVACAKQPHRTPSSNARTDASMADLALLMRNDINPAFSKLTFLVFHGSSEDNPTEVRAELARAAGVLRTSIGQLRTWRQPPTETEQGREVFYTYAMSVDAATQRLLDAVQREDASTAATQLQQISRTCNSCHHFFRLDIEDSVVPDKR
jgi:hypothetical protein